MRASAAEVGTAVSASSKDGLVCAESVESAILHVEGDDTNTLTILHDQIQSEVFDEKVGVVSERLTVEGMQQSMPSSVSSSSTTVCLTTLSVFERLTTESALINLSLLRPREGYTEVLKLQEISALR